MKKQINIPSLKRNWVAKVLATLFVCLLGTVSMYITKGRTGTGWAILGVLIIWLCG